MKEFSIIMMKKHVIFEQRKANAEETCELQIKHQFFVLGSKLLRKIIIEKFFYKEKKLV